MTDICTACIHHEDINACLRADCYQHETWMVRMLRTYLRVAIDSLAFYADEEAWMRVYSEDGASWRQPPAHRDRGLIARRAMRFNVDSRLDRLERFACRVVNELSDPMGERWCDEPDDDRGLLKALLAEAERVVAEGREADDAE